MKKTYTLTIVAILFSFVANAQISKGTLFLGGSLGYSSETTKDKAANTETTTLERTTFNITPSVGYFVADKTAVGIMAGFSSTESTFFLGNGNKVITTNTPINVGIFADRYFMIVPEFGFTAGVFANYIGGSSKREETDNSGTTLVTERSVSGFNTGLRGGAIWFPTPHIGFSAQVGVLSFNSTTTTVDNSNPEISTTESGFDFDLGSMNLNFGFHYYFFN